jgi:hypothetical protein
MTPVLLDVSSFGMSPIFLALFLAFAAWKVISWILYLSKKSELDAQISEGRAKAEQGPGGAANAATVYVYRLSNFVGALNPCYIHCDQAPIAGLKSGAHAVCQVAPGNHVFSSSASPSTFTLNLEAGRQYYIRTGVVSLGKFAFEPVPSDRARSECVALRSLPEPPRASAAPGEPPPLLGPGAQTVVGAAEPAPPPLPAEAEPVNEAPIVPTTAAPPPAPPLTAPPAADTSQPRLLWYQHVWTALPFLLVVAGGLVGGACGGAAWAVNQQVFRKTKDPVLRYVWTGLISAGAVAAYLVVALLVASLLAPKG